MVLPTTEAEMAAAIKTAVDSATSGTLVALQDERKKHADIKTQLADAKTQLEASTAATAAAQAAKDTTALEAKGDYDKALEKQLADQKGVHDAKLAEITAASTGKDQTISKLLIDGEILKMTENAVNPAEVVTLMKAFHKIEVVDGVVVVKDAAGLQMLDAAGKPETVGGAYEKFMGDRLHLMKPGTTIGGNGTLPGQTKMNAGAGDLLSLKKNYEAAMKPDSGATMPEKIAMKREIYSLENGGA